MENFADTVTSGALAYDSNMQETPQMPFWAKTLENIPAASAVMGNYGRRGANTILKGPRRTTFGSTRAMTGGPIGRAIKHNLRPFSRFRSTEHLTGRMGPYRPFFVADAANAVDRGLRGQATSKLGQKLSGPMRMPTLDPKDTPLMTGGFYSRLTAAGRIGNMSDKRFARYLGSGKANVGGFLNQMGVPASDINRMMYTADRGAMQRSLLIGSGRVTGAMGGYFSAFTSGALSPVGSGMGPAPLRGAAGLTGSSAKGFHAAARMAGSLGINLTDDAALTVGRVARATRATMSGASWGAKGLAAARGAGLIGGRVGLMAVPGVNVAMGAWMAYDLAKMGTQLAGYSMKTAGEAYLSFKGDTRTKIMGQTFKDSEAAMTSRARGVQAIQNSRLNARSALGAEAGGLSAHFG